LYWKKSSNKKSTAVELTNFNYIELYLSCSMAFYLNLLAFWINWYQINSIAVQTHLSSSTTGAL